MDIYKLRQLLHTKSIFDLDLNVGYYARVSSEKMEQLNSLDHQSAHYDELIRSNQHWHFAGAYIDEGISGIHAETRDEFQRLIQDAKLGKLDLVITKEISRFARNTLDSIQYTRMLLGYGVCVWFQNDGINTADEDAELRLTIMAGVAQDEIRKLSSRVRFGHEQAIKQGIVLGNSLFYGYTKEHGRLIIDEKEAEMIRLIFQYYATGEWSTPQIERRLYELGYRNRKGNKISRTVIQHIITNPKYKGYYVGGKVKIVDMFSKKQYFVPQEEWVMYKDDGSHVPAIVSEDLWDRANHYYQIRSSKVRSRKTSCKPKNLFTGKIFCSVDGTAYWLKQRMIRGKKDARWVCSHRIQNGKDSCPSFGLAEEELLHMTAELIRFLGPDIGKITSIYMELFRQMLSGTIDQEREERIRKQIGLCKQKKEKLIDLNLDGYLSKDEFRERKQNLDEEIASLEQKLEPITNGMKLADMEQRLQQLEKKVKNYAEINESHITPALISDLFRKIEVNPTGEREAVITFYLNDGRKEEKTYRSPVSCSDNMFKKMIEAQEKQMAGK